MRKEQEIFDDLAKLCSSPGYIHTIAYFCLRDTVILYSEVMKAKDMQHLFSPTRLIRTEISTLIGLMIKNDIDYDLPSVAGMQAYMKTTEALLDEMHGAMSAEMFFGLDLKKIETRNFNPFTGKALREPIFYGGESAYSHQYRDLSPKKYALDNQWLVANKGFTITEARDIARSVITILNDKLTDWLMDFKKTRPSRWSALPGFTFSTDEVAQSASLDKVLTERILTAFTVTTGENNSGFCSLHDFNVANAFPLLRTSDGKFILFQQYTFDEALYDAPFYWMTADKDYMPKAMQHRGRFTEEFARERLELIFGKGNVFSNVDILKSKSEKSGEIDVLVFFGDRAIVLQAKSKRLTLEAKRGNDGRIRDDFKKSIQDSYDQGYECANMLLDLSYKLIDANFNEITRPAHLKEIYILCVVSDHYPALAFQSRQFLKFKAHNIIQPPLVMDVFAIDTMTEMLESPLRLLSYVNRRVQYHEKVRFFHEHTVLSYHLKNNLWVDSKYDLVSLSDDISSDLDVAMLVRREGIPGKRTPDGILTRLVGTALGRIIAEIELKAEPSLIDLGFLLLTLSEDTVRVISEGIEKITDSTKRDGQNHNITVAVANTGLTAHSNVDSIEIAYSRLHDYCECRKYVERTEKWFGICLNPHGTLRFNINLDYKWEESAEMSIRCHSLSRRGNLGDKSAVAVQKKKIGRNDPCPCGSGRKYKRCHGK